MVVTEAGERSPSSPSQSNERWFYMKSHTIRRQSGSFIDLMPSQLLSDKEKSPCSGEVFPCVKTSREKRARGSNSLSAFHPLFFPPPPSSLRGYDGQGRSSTGLHPSKVQPCALSSISFHPRSPSVSPSTPSTLCSRSASRFHPDPSLMNHLPR